MSTLVSAEKIVVLRRGEIVQTGTHRELIGEDGYYKELMLIQ
jgi:ATP-binding cassette subfamily B protein